MLQASLNAVPTDTTPSLTPEAQAGFILGFMVVAFTLLLLGAYSVFLTSKFKLLGHDLTRLEKRIRELEKAEDAE